MGKTSKNRIKDPAQNPDFHKGESPASGLLISQTNPNQQGFRHRFAEEFPHRLEEGFHHQPPGLFHRRRHLLPKKDLPSEQFFTTNKFYFIQCPAPAETAKSDRFKPQKWQKRSGPAALCPATRPATRPATTRASPR
jgi:hypothetical protein